MFCDRARITVRGGRGGDGIVSFRRAKYEPKGGPNGGDGGRGGDVFFSANQQQVDLFSFATKKKFQAKDGHPGDKRKQTGADGEDLILKVPIGTVVYEISRGHEKRLLDLKKRGDEKIIVRGGQGGRGNTFFKSSINQAPRKATPGQPGEERKLLLKLKLLTDVGLIGQPNAGKSTLLSTITRAKPKIADYPFTTLSPNLGVIEYKRKRLVVADIPGLIKNAHQGKGLGDRFLQHVERCQLLVHLIDITEKDIIKSYNLIRQELKSYNASLGQKEELIVLNKLDLVTKSEARKKKLELEEKTGKELFLISAATKQGTGKLLDKIIEMRVWA
jgi:GTPase